MFKPPFLHRFLLAVCAPLLLPLGTFAQFTEIVFPPARTASLADFSTALGEALEAAFENEDDFDGSCGTLDRGFGTYLAPRMDPALRRHRIYFNTEYDDKIFGASTVSGEQFPLTPTPFFLARSGEEFSESSTLRSPSW